MLLITPHLSSSTPPHKKNPKGNSPIVSPLAFLGYKGGQKYVCACVNLSLSETFIPLCRVKSHLRDPFPHWRCLETASSEKWGMHVNMYVCTSALPEQL